MKYISAPRMTNFVNTASTRRHCDYALTTTVSTSATFLKQLQTADRNTNTNLKHSWRSNDSPDDRHLFSLVVIYNSPMNANITKPQTVCLSHMMDDLLREFCNFFFFFCFLKPLHLYGLWTDTQQHTLNSSISCALAQRWDRYVHMESCEFPRQSRNHWTLASMLFFFLTWLSLKKTRRVESIVFLFCPCDYVEWCKAVSQQHGLLCYWQWMCYSSENFWHCWLMITLLWVVFLQLMI